MKNLLIILALAGAFLASSSAAHAQQGDAKKDADASKKPQEKKAADWTVDLEQFKKLLEQFTDKDGNVDPEKIKKFGEKFGVGDGKFDPEPLKKMIEQFTGKGGALDPDQLKKMMDQFTAKGGPLDLDQFKKMMDQYTGKGGPLDLDMLKKMVDDIRSKAGKGDDGKKAKDKGDDKDKKMSKSVPAYPVPMYVKEEDVVKEVMIGAHVVKLGIGYDVVLAALGLPEHTEPCMSGGDPAIRCVYDRGPAPGVINHYTLIFTKNGEGKVVLAKIAVKAAR